MKMLLSWVLLLLWIQQRVFCSKKMDIIITLKNREVYNKLYDSVVEGAFLGLDQCRQQFKHKKWNCTIAIADERKKQLKDITMSSIQHDTRETAFAHSITSAGVTYALTRDCRIGKFEDCACVNNRKVQIQSKNERIWRGGCSENTKYGEVMGKHFLEAIDIENASEERKRLIAHNNDIGRKAVKASLEKHCRCHGVTGSCLTQTCWLRLPVFKTIAKYLEQKYKNAKRVRYVKNKFKTKVTKGYKVVSRREQTLIYTEPSPDYCVRNETVASQGLLGRVCQGSEKNLSQCRQMCKACGLKSINYKEFKKVNCNCRFHWCCKVKCELCEQPVSKTKCIAPNNPVVSKIRL